MATNDVLNSEESPLSRPALEQDERWLLVQRIAGSKYFARASQLREILLYVTRQALLQPGRSIPEHEIAFKVLGRRENFNANDDNIVRVRAGHLRSRLEQYFSAEGMDEPYVLAIPKGTYVPTFAPKAAYTKQIEDEQNGSHSQQISTITESLTSPGKSEQIKYDSSLTTQGSEQSVAHMDVKLRSASYPVRSKFSIKTSWYIAAVAFCLGLMLMGFVLGTGVPKRAIRNIFEAKMFDANFPISIVTTDSSLVFLQNILDTDISIGSYTGGQYPGNILDRASDPIQRATLANVTAGRYTSLGDLTVSRQATETAEAFRVPTTIRYARYMSVRDFEKGNFILIGSRRGNPWTSLFEPQLNFFIEEDHTTHSFHFRNRNPKNSEDHSYFDGMDGKGNYVSYVDVALAPNLTKTGYVLIFNGLIMDGNEAAANLLFNDQDLPAAITKSADLNPSKNFQSVEMFLRVFSVAGAPSKCEVVATRVVPQ